MQRKEHNIILINAQRIEAGPWYFTAARNTRVVGEYTAKFIDYLVSKGFHLKSLQLVGLSLGAQMAGVCGRSVRSGRISRITGKLRKRPRKSFPKKEMNCRLGSSRTSFHKAPQKPKAGQRRRGICGRDTFRRGNIRLPPSCGARRFLAQPGHLPAAGLLAQAGP